MFYGAIHSPPPAAIQLLSVRADLHLMTAPLRTDWFAKCPADFDALGNDVNSNCVPCADLRIIQARRANAWGDSWKPTRDMSLALYSLRTGYNPATGKPDQGTDTAVDMTAWVQNGIRLDEQNLDIVKWAIVDPSNDDHVAKALGYVGPLAVTTKIPVALEDPANWGQAPDLTNTDWTTIVGTHRICLGKAEGRERTLRTWGMDLLLHPDSWDQYVISVDAPLSWTWFDATGLSPAGLDRDALNADMALIGS